MVVTRMQHIPASATYEPVTLGKQTWCCLSVCATGTHTYDPAAVWSLTRSLSTRELGPTSRLRTSNANTGSTGTPSYGVAPSSRHEQPLVDRPHGALDTAKVTFRGARARRGASLKPVQPRVVRQRDQAGLGLPHLQT